MIMINAAEFKRFYSDPAFWPEGSYHDDAEITINDAAYDGSVSLMEVADTAMMTLDGGDLYLSADGEERVSLEDHLAHWLKNRHRMLLVVEVLGDDPADLIQRQAEIAGAIKAAGGRVI